MTHTTTCATRRRTPLVCLIFGHRYFDWSGCYLLPYCRRCGLRAES